MQGKKFGKLLVIKEVGRKRRKVTWLCQCDCGNEKIVIGTNLITGITKSCGCYSREVIGKTNIKNLTGKKTFLLYFTATTKNTLRELVESKFLLT